MTAKSGNGLHSQAFPPPCETDTEARSIVRPSAARTYLIDNNSEGSGDDDFEFQKVGAILLLLFGN